MSPAAARHGGHVACAAMTKIMQLAVITGVVATSNVARAQDPWTTDDDFVDGSVAFAYGVQNDSQYVYAVGYGTEAGQNVAKVRRRSLTTGGWQPVDTYTGIGQAIAQAVALDTSNGTIYVAGKTYAGPSSSRWYIRTSTDHGASWNTIHTGSVYVNGQNSIGGLRVNGTAFVSIAAT